MTVAPPSLRSGAWRAPWPCSGGLSLTAFSGKNGDGCALPQGFSPHAGHRSESSRTGEPQALQLTMTIWQGWQKAGISVAASISASQ